MPVRGAPNARRTLYLSNAALSALLRATGGVAGHGQAVTAGRGWPLRAEDVRLDRLRTSLARIEPATSSVDWNFHGLRRAACVALGRNDEDPDDVGRLLGVRPARPGKLDHVPVVRRLQTARAAALAERWSRMLDRPDVVGSRR